MGERLDPEQVTEIMNGAFAVLNAAVARYDGTIARLMGDAVLALFGAPVAHEDDAERAVRAGLEIVTAARVYGQQVRQAYGVEFNVRVGINSGLAVLAFVGDELKTEYTAMGDTTNVAARMQSAADPGTVLISAETHRLVTHLFDFTPRGPIEVKGKSVPIESYEVVAPRATPGKPRGLEGLSSPLVGRDVELLELRHKLEALSSGRGSFIVVAGEAGLGKSRLAAELRGLAAREMRPGVSWLETRALSYAQSTAHELWRQLLRLAIGARAEDSPEVARRKLESACETWRVAETDRAVLEAILAIESEASLEALKAVEAGNLVARMGEAVRACLSGMARSGPTVVAFDDLHWADTPSLSLLASVAELVDDHPLLMLCLLRPEKESASWHTIQEIVGRLGASARELLLAPLGPEHAQQLLVGLLQIENLPHRTRALILQKSDGNPFFLEEVIRELIDSGHLVREDGRWRATPNIVDVTIPDTLSGLLSARIDHLQADTKRVLQAAAVIGRTFAYRVLCEMRGIGVQSTDELESHLATLAYEELVREWARDPEIEYIFKHALTQEAAYGLLLMRARRALHRQVGEVLERLYPERREELASVLEHHFWQGEEWERAAQYAMRAGARAAKVYALQEAVEHYDRAYDALVKNAAEPPLLLYDVILAWSPIALKFRSREEVIERLRTAEEIARSLDDRPRLAQALVWIANVYFMTGLRSHGMPALLEGYQLSQELGDERLSVLPMFITTAMLVDNDPRTALQPLGEVIELAHRHGLKEVEAHALATRGQAHMRLGEVGLAYEDVTRGLELVRTTGSLLIEADVEMVAALVYFDSGDVERAKELGRSGSQKALQVRGMECACEGFLLQGVFHLYANEVREAVAALQQSFSLSEFSGFEDLRNRSRAALALAEALSGRAEALADAENSLAAARAMGDAFGAAYISQGLGSVSLRLGDLERAEQHLRVALDYYREKDIQPNLRRVLELMAELYGRQGRAEEAAQTRAEAQRLLERLRPLAVAV
jgi:class 3 adenylate cyclase/tetratricopeptide (TPR) repeat protein